MIREEGIVVALEGDFAVVSGQRQKMCGTCHNSNTCTVLSGGLGQRSIKIRARNACHARVGERVFIEISERTFLRASFLVYILPLVVLFAMVSWARFLIQTLGWSVDIEAFSALVGFVSLALTFYWLQRRSARHGRDGGPVVVEVLSADMCHNPAPPSFLS
ncbi:MAG: SoxR reducing system RseC family protein [Magnetococcales bacterium]|nr:SoxR reducing system RseC family protein [Magnetococcales bacterium]